MPIEIVPYTRELEPRVREFNQRMRDGGTSWGWYERCVDDWLPERGGHKVWREHYVALEDGRDVRGAYALKPQEWRVRGEARLVTDWQGPVSEGLLSLRYASLGLRMIRDMQKRQPLLYSWGHGGEEAKMLNMLRSMKWQTHATPFCLRVCHPFPFLRESRYLRRTPNAERALDALAWSGAGWLGLHALHAALGFRATVRGRRPRAPRFEVVDRFGDWADALWERCRDAYAAIGLRDADTLNALLPQAGWPAAIRLRVYRGGETIGWAAVMDNALAGDPRFGSMRVGSLVDCLALPEDAPLVVAAADRFLRARGVHMIGSNQAHPRWIEAFEANGYVILPKRRYFAMSPDLFRALAPFEQVSQGLHLTNLDGHGPHGF